jgi:hypothetical protein
MGNGLTLLFEPLPPLTELFFVAVITFVIEILIVKVKGLIVGH